MVWWPWLPKQVDTRTDDTTGRSPGCCEYCTGYGMVMLGGVTLLCWEHYCAVMKAQREAANGQSTRDDLGGGGA